MIRLPRLIPLAAVVAFAAPAAVMAQGKPTIAIMQFENGSFGPGAKDYEGLVKGVPGVLVTDLQGNTNIRVIERAEVQKLVDEQNLVKGGHVDQATAIKVGKLLGAQHMIFGTYIVDTKKNFRIDARAVNVETGEIEHVERVDDKEDNIMPALSALSAKLNSGMHLPAPTRRTGDASPATGAQQAGAPAAAAAPAAQPKLPMRVAVMYGKALDAKDRGEKGKAVEYFSAVLKEFPDFPAASREMASLK